MKFTIEESDQFLKDVEEAAFWILLSNLEQSKNLAEKIVEALLRDLESLKARLRDFPDSGESDCIQGIRGFPLYDGRYSAKWIVHRVSRTVTLITLVDCKYPKELRTVFFED